jgi:beta-glucosidase
MSLKRFPDGFVWGVATSAQQIEGARREGGRGDSIWDRYAETPGAIRDGSNPFTACDHYHRWRDDIELLSWLGVNAYRFSVAWPRILPDGRGVPNAAGLDFYESLVDGLLAAGIKPFVTLNHWDLPQALQDAGGWPARDTVSAFVEYADAVTRRLGDRVTSWATHNEPWCIAVQGYEEAGHAPGHRDVGEALRTAHHLLLSHGLAVRTIRENIPETEIGIVLNLAPGWPATETDADRDAARIHDGLFNRWYLDPLFRGAYPADAIRDRIRFGQLESEELAFVEDGDMEIIGTPLDCLGVNYYGRSVVRMGASDRPEGVCPVPPEELTEMGWEVFPEGLTLLLERLVSDYAPPAIYITESGAAFPDKVDPDGRIRDPRRLAFLRDHMAAASDAITAGVPLRGYFVWSLMDNFEWQHGYTMRFGLFRVDYDDLKRTPKESAHWYRGVTAANAVADERP